MPPHAMRFPPGEHDLVSAPLVEALAPDLTQPSAVTCFQLLPASRRYFPVDFAASLSMTGSKITMTDVPTSGMCSVNG